jgi:ubiquinol-cytochrome c reductase cytochrome b subunit
MGPYRPDMVSTGAQPDWYMGFSEGLIRVMPGWEINLWGHTLVLGVFIPLVIFPLVLVAIAVYPFIESWVTGDKREHHILDRPRNVPTRTAFGAAWISWYFVLLVGGGNDIWATHFHLSINSITWFVRISFFIVPFIVFVITKRICLGLQRRDKDKVLHGRESGIIKRLPHGEFIEVHEPLSQEALHTLTAHEQYKPAEIGPTVDENGVERRVKGTERLRSKLSEGFYGEESQIPKPTVEEFKEITSGHGHH